MKRNNLEIILKFLDKHPWESRILAGAIALSLVKSDLLTIIQHFK